MGTTRGARYAEEPIRGDTKSKKGSIKVGTVWRILMSIVLGASNRGQESYCKQTGASDIGMIREFEIDLSCSALSDEQR